MATEAKKFPDIPFEKAAKRFHPKKSITLALRHEGAPKQYNTEHGTEVAEDGDYVVQVGTVVKQNIVPPSVDPKTGERKAGEIRDVVEPVLEVMKGEDFLALYEPA